MSTDTKLAEALNALQPTAETILRSRPMDFTDDTYPGFQPLLDEPMAQVLRVYEGTNNFLRDVRRKQPWTARQSRAVANILRHALRGDGPKVAKGGGVAAPQDREYPCFKCGKKIVGKTALYDHKRNECSGIFRSFVPPSGPATQQQVPVLDYKPQYNVDLRLFPPGRFAVVDPQGNTRFIIVTELKRRTRLAGRFVWTKFRYANEYLNKGDRTVREQIGDTKKFIGKQTLQQSVYHGEEEDLLVQVANDPAAAMKLYGQEMHRCAYCGRSLTDAESRLRGIGPDCWENKHVPYIRGRNLFTQRAGSF